MMYSLLRKSTILSEELIKFIITGFTTVILDFIVYRGMLLVTFNNYEFSKSIGCIVGLILAYLMNKFWTFNDRKSSKKQILLFFILYFSTLIINVKINTITIMALDSVSKHAIEIAFIFATGVGAVINYFGLKLFVFTRAY